MCSYLGDLLSRCCYWYFAPCRNNEGTEDIEESPYADIFELAPIATPQNIPEAAVPPEPTASSSLKAPSVQSGRNKYETTAEIDERMKRVLIRELRDSKKKAKCVEDNTNKSPDGSTKRSSAKLLWDDDKTA